jgi:hypothetical protein
MDPDAIPSFHPPRSVPFALRAKVEQKLDWLQKKGTLEPVAPIVVVLNNDWNNVLICGDFSTNCGDFSVTVNLVSKFRLIFYPKSIRHISVGPTWGVDRAGLRVKRSRCAFGRPSVTFLGHVNSLPTLPERVKEAPAPKSVSELKSYLGMLT